MSDNFYEQTTDRILKLHKDYQHPDLLRKMIIDAMEEVAHREWTRKNMGEYDGAQY